MNRRLKLVTSAFFITLSLFVLRGTAYATEGTAEMVSTSGEKARCFASSVLLEDNKFKVTISCRDLVYPPAEDLFAYVLWATPVAGGNPERLGPLGVGKAEFNTNDAFSQLFVTTEAAERPRTPSTRVVLRGSIAKVPVLEGQPAAQPAPTAPSEPAESFGEIIEKPSPTPTPTPASTIGSRLRRAGLIFVIVVFVLIIIIAAITRSRG